MSSFPALKFGICCCLSCCCCCCCCSTCCCCCFLSDPKKGFLPEGKDGGLLAEAAAAEVREEVEESRLVHLCGTGGRGGGCGGGCAEWREAAVSS